jgi:hypothetical protein
VVEAPWRARERLASVLLGKGEVGEVCVLDQVNGKTRSMLDRYNIVGAEETAAALSQTDAYLSTQPRERNVEQLAEHAQNAHSSGRRRKTR